MPRTKVRVTCAVCGQKFPRDQYEVKRNERLGRANTCSRSCQAVWMNWSPENSKRMKARRAREKGSPGPRRKQ